MRNIWIIAKREFDHYFISPIAYVVAFLILGIIGFLFAINIYFFIQNALQSFGQTPEVTIITGVFGFLLVFTIPAITMRLIADEARMGTLELLLTAPIRDFELIAGKWLGAFLFMLTILAVTLVFPLMLNSLVSPGIDQKLVISSYLGLMLVIASFLALGVGISAIFTNQIAALFVTFITFLLLWFVIGIPSQVLQGAASGVFQYLDMNSHYNALSNGSIKLSDLIYFFSLIALGLFMGTTAIETRRWR
jgi:gliding motility-associated transport system permease protein